MFREVDPLLFFYFTFLFAALFAVGDSLLLAIAFGWVLCNLLSAQLTSCCRANVYYIRRPSSCTNSRGSRVVLVLLAGGIVMLVKLWDSEYRNFHGRDGPSFGLGFMRL